MNAPKILAFAVDGEALTDLGADGDEDERAAVPEEAHRYAHRVGGPLERRALPAECAARAERDVDAAGHVLAALEDVRGPLAGASVGVACHDTS